MDELVALCYRTAPVGLGVVDRDLRFITVNAQLAAWHAVHPDDHVGRHVSELLPPGAPYPEAALKKVLSDGESITGLAVTLRPPFDPENEHHYIVNMHALRNGDDQVEAVNVAVEEVTDLEETRRRFRQIAEGISGVFWITDWQQGRVLYVSPAYEQIWGRSADSIYANAEDWIEAIHPDDREAIRAGFYETAPLGRFDHSYRIVRPDGSIRWIRDRGYPVIDEDGTVRRIVGVAEDITTLRRAETQLRDLRQRLEGVARLNTVGEMAATLAHELSQPLAALSIRAEGCRELLRKGADPSQLVEPIDEIVRLSQRVTEVVKRVRRLIRHDPAQWGSIRLDELIDEVVALVASDTARLGIELTTTGHDTAPPIVADIVQIQHVLLNLVRNAIEAVASSAGDKSIAIEIQSVDDAHVSITVRDTGPGIPPSIAAELFAPFVTTKPDGVGLGLAISKTVVERHGGQIEVVSGDSGAAFRVTLPRTPELPS